MLIPFLLSFQVSEALMTALWEETALVQLLFSTSPLAKGSARAYFTTSEKYRSQVTEWSLKGDYGHTCLSRAGVEGLQA